MNITINKDVLLNTLVKCGPFTPSKSTLPIIQSVLVEATENNMTFYATTLAAGILITIDDVEIKEPGKVAIPASLFRELVSTYKSGPISVKCDPVTIEVQLQQKGKLTRIKSYPGDAFPILPTVEGEPQIVDGDALKNIIKKTAMAAATEESRPALTGVNFNHIISSTNGFHASIYKNQFELKDVLIPRDSAEKVNSIIEEGPVSVFYSGGQVCFEQNSTRIFSNLIEGQYPDITQIIKDTGYKTTIHINCSDLTQAVKTANIYAKQNANMVMLKVTENRLTVSAESADMGDNTEHVDCITIGDENYVILNGQYMLDILKVIDTPTVSLFVTNESSPVIFKEKDNEDFIHIIMPLHKK